MTEHESAADQTGLDDVTHRMATFVAEVPFPMAMLDRGLRYVAWSRQWAETYARGDDDLSGQYHYDVLPDIPGHWREAHERALAGEPMSSEEDRIERADGHVNWHRWRINPVRGSDGQVDALIMFVEDITERKQSELRSHTRDERLRLMLENMGIGIFERNYATDERDFSDTFLNMLGLELAQAPESIDDMMNLLNPLDKNVFRAAVDKARDPQGDGHFTAEVQPLVNGSVRYMQVRGQVQLDGTGADAKPLQFVGSLVDETERRTLQEALAHAQRLETVGRMAGVIAHDFNNLLTVIFSNLELAMLRTQDGDLADLLQRAIDAAEIGGSFNKRLLALAGGHAGQAVVIAVDSHIAGVWAMLERLTNAAFTLRFVPGANLAAVRIGPSELDGALLNLVVNARDAQPDGGEIAVRTERVTLDNKAALEYLGGRPGDFVRLSVTDHGIGMTPEIAARARAVL